MDLQDESISVDTLYPMLEGQVAALSAGVISPDKAADLLEALFESDIYRPDQQSFMLYPDRALPAFLSKNRVPAADVEAIPLLQRMLSEGNERIVVQDPRGCFRFNADFRNVGDLNAQLNSLSAEYGDDLEAAREPLQALYEKVFNHRAFTGRSGGMFGFEGLGCIYWHMVSKLLLAVQENFYAALDSGTDGSAAQHLGQLYYRVRNGIGFNKSPARYGAFPADPYSHTSGNKGARQPGMTGQVKEEVLTRFGELGIRVSGGAVYFRPVLLRACEFDSEPGTFRYLDVDEQWQEVIVPAAGLAFSWCQVPVLYTLGADPKLVVDYDDGNTQTLPDRVLPADDSAHLFQRNGRIRQLTVTFDPNQLFAG
jgi:hypothetical protein